MCRGEREDFAVNWPRLKCALLGWMAFKGALAQASHASEEDQR
jgi:NifU-like protein involved in Fe-S cluster formation